MKKLSLNQLQSIYNLAENSLINSTKIQHENGVTRITIESAIGAEFDAVDGFILQDELGELFPNLEYFGTPAKHTNPMTRLDEEIYFINWEDETLIWLVMVKGAEKRKWSLEEIMDREG